MKVNSIKHNGSENIGFKINRPNGRKDNTFIHFIDSVEFLINGEIVTTERNTCIFIPKNTPQFYGNSNVFLHNWMHYDDYTANFFKFIGIKENYLYVLPSTSFITELFAEMETEFLSNGKFSNEILRLKLQEFAYKFIRSEKFFIDSGLQKNDIKAIQRIKSTIMSDFSADWSLDSLAGIANMSRTKFCTTYKSYYGVSPINDLISIRIQHAKVSLQHSNIPIKMLSEILGYTNEYHFIKQFKKQTGITPKQYALLHNTNYQNTPND